MRDRDSSERMRGRSWAPLHGVVATPMPPWEKRPRAHEAGRVCAEDGCATRLSIYNEGKRCFQHEPKDYSGIRIGRPRKHA